MSNKVISIFDKNGFHKEMPWLSYTTMEYIPKNGYQFIEYSKFLDKKINEKVSEEEFFNGTRYLKIKLMGHITPEKYEELKLINKDNKVLYKYCYILECDLLTLDLTQKEQNNGYRYLKIYVINNRFEKGWITYSEKEQGWEVSYNKNTKTNLSRTKKRKLNYRKNQQKMMDEVKKYISVE